MPEVTASPEPDTPPHPDELPPIPATLAGVRFFRHRRHRVPGHGVVERLCAASRLRVALLVRPGGGAAATERAGARSSATTASTACARAGAGFDGDVARRLMAVAGESRPTAWASTTRPGARSRAATGHPLGRRGQLRLAPRQRRRGEPARPQPGGRDVEAAADEFAAAPPIWSRFHRVRGRHPPRPGARGAPARHAVHHRRRLGGRGGRGPPAARPTSTRAPQPGRRPVHQSPRAR